MNYFILKEDRNINYLLNFSQYLNIKNKWEDVVIQSNITEKTVLADYIEVKKFTFSNHIFSEKIKNVISAYREDTCFYGIFVTAQDFKSQYPYWRLDTNTLKIYEICHDFSVLEFPFIFETIKNEVLFCILQYKKEYLCFREDLAESILRRCPINIKFRKINIKKE